MIDYASEYRTDFGDIYLLAHCKFLLGSCAGVTQVATIFKRPVAVANWVHIEFSTCFRDGDIFIPKTVWHKEEKRLLSLQEMLGSGVGRFLQRQQYEKMGLELVDNTPDEILALCREMNQRMDGVWEGTKEDVVLQERFRWIMGQPQYRCAGTAVRVGAEFLRQHPWWLE